MIVYSLRTKKKKNLCQVQHLIKKDQVHLALYMTWFWSGCVKEKQLLDQCVLKEKYNKQEGKPIIRTRNEVN